MMQIHHRWSAIALMFLIMTLLAGPPASAQSLDGATPLWRLRIFDRVIAAALNARPAPSQQVTSAARWALIRPTHSRALDGIVGAISGGLVGAIVGAAIEGDRCACDAPGFRGAMIGMTAGAVAGGVVFSR